MISLLFCFDAVGPVRHMALDVGQQLVVELRSDAAFRFAGEVDGCVEAAFVKIGYLYLISLEMNECLNRVSSFFC